jgi:hypothetical protein
MLQNEKLLNSILHEVRNGNLLNLSAVIFTESMKENPNIEEIEKAYKKLALNIEKEIKKGIENV